MSVPNQHKVIIKKTKCNKNNYYACINLNSLYFAMKDLTPSAFKLWVYFAKNQENYQFNLSAADVAAHGLPQSTYYRARKELEQKGYLTAAGGNKFIFKDCVLNDPFSQNESFLSQNEQRNNIE